MGYGSEPIRLTVQPSLPGQYLPEPVVVIGGVPGIAGTGASVPNAAGANPTAAEFLALLTSLRNAGFITP